ncbi:hypothetical protein ABE473_06110 [Stenotrophomonas sp. TWI700]|uniref:hypothetical protein n=1 Tax=Stenotrophomonas sp. TWI700 TaxID=3136792 RepID=UPI0032088F77
MTTEKPAAALSTSDGARCYIAHFFAREMGRHDFATYIATELAADFACALAQHLAACQPGAQVPVAWVHEEDSARVISARQKATALRDQGASGSSVRRYSVPAFLKIQPAQGIDLGQQQDAARWRAIAPLLSVEWDEDEQLKRWTWIDFKGDAPAIPSPTRQEYTSVDEAVDALIGQRDATPGVANA